MLCTVPGTVLSKRYITGDERGIPEVALNVWVGRGSAARPVPTCGNGRIAAVAAAFADAAAIAAAAAAAAASPVHMGQNKAPQAVEVVPVLTDHSTAATHPCGLLPALQSDRVFQSQPATDRHRLQDSPVPPTLPGAHLSASVVCTLHHRPCGTL